MLLLWLQLDHHADEPGLEKLSLDSNQYICLLIGYLYRMFFISNLSAVCMQLNSRPFLTKSISSSENFLSHSMKPTIYLVARISSFIFLLPFKRQTLYFNKHILIKVALKKNTKKDKQKNLTGKFYGDKRDRALSYESPEFGYIDKQKNQVTIFS